MSRILRIAISFAGSVSLAFHIWFFLTVTYPSSSAMLFMAIPFALFASIGALAASGFIQRFKSEKTFAIWAITSAVMMFAQACLYVWLPYALR